MTKIDRLARIESRAYFGVAFRHVRGSPAMNFQFRLTLALIFSSMIFNLGILPANAQGPQFLPGRISIVWPQDGLGHGVSIAQARALNLSIWPIGRVSCVPSQNVSLLIAKNNEPALVWGKLGQVNLRTGQFGKFPTIDLTIFQPIW